MFSEGEWILITCPEYILTPLAQDNQCEVVNKEGSEGVK